METGSKPSAGVSLIGRIASGCECVSLACLAVIALLIFAQIVLRNAVAFAHPGLEEVARFAHITLVFLLVPLLFREGLHVTIDLVPQWLGPRGKRWLEGLAALLTLAYAAGFLASEYQFMRKNGGVSTPGLGLPNLLFFAGAYFGMALLLVTAVEKLWATLRRAPEGGAR